MLWLSTNFHINKFFSLNFYTALMNYIFQTTYLLQRFFLSFRDLNKEVSSFFDQVVYMYKQ